MKNILIPVDFSEASENAAVFAAGLAEFYGADLWLYHTYLHPVGLPEYGYPLITVAEIQDSAEYEVEVLIKRLQRSVRYPLNISYKVELNSLHAGLPLFCEEKKPDLVVMGITGKQSRSKIKIGSNTLAAIQYLKYPILVVPKNAGFKLIHKIGFACDYKNVVETSAIGHLKNIVNLFGASLHVINVTDPKLKNPVTPEEYAYLHLFLRELDVKYHTVENEDVTVALNEFAREESLDFMITIPKHHNFVEKLFTKSHTMDLIYHTDLPVLCIHD